MKNVWGRTLLSVYRYLERITGSIDKLVEMRALHSNSFTKNTYEGYNVILNLIHTKDKFFTLKDLIEIALDFMDGRMARVLIEKYIDGKPSAAIAEGLDVCSRTYFRYVNAAERSFEAELAKMGYTNEVLTEKYSDEFLIMSAFDKVASAKADTLISLDGSINKAFKTYSATM